MVTEGILKYLDGFLAPSDFRHKTFLAQLNVFFKVLGSKSGASARLQAHPRLIHEWGTHGAHVQNATGILHSQHKTTP